VAKLLAGRFQDLTHTAKAGEGVSLFFVSGYRFLGVENEDILGIGRTWSYVLLKRGSMSVACCSFA